MQRTSKDKENVQKLYCHCMQPYDKLANGDMIGCDGRECINEWAHFLYAKRKTAPREKWYCRDCKGKKSQIMYFECCCLPFICMYKWRYYCKKSIKILQRFYLMCYFTISKKNTHVQMTND